MSPTDGSSPIYLDHAATTPERPEVRESMRRCREEAFGNPSSVHRWGRRASAALEEARERVAALIGADRREVFFVRGGTESDNLAVLGRADAVRSSGHAPFVVISSVEHSAVREAAAAVAAGGGEAARLRVARDGSIDLDDLDALLDRDPAVVSVIWASNETGLVLPVPDVARRAADRGIAVHSDAVQAIAWMPVRVDETPLALLTFSGHKLGGPPGTAALYVRDGTELSPRLHGGGQEASVRPGTEDVAGAAGLAVALEHAVAERSAEAERIGALRDRLERGLGERIGGLRVHGEEGGRAPHVLNIGIPRIDAADLIRALDLEGVAASSGSACRSGAVQSGAGAGSVLDALYGPEIEGVAPLRLSLGRTTTPAEVERAEDIVVRVVERLGRLTSARSGAADARGPSTTGEGAGIA